ncbi:MAG: hypothetical protein Q4D06_08850, partial [Coriobacteriia bacterium]|nr:hypothetical protein [Coriobacteriia bacterium]
MITEEAIREECFSQTYYRGLGIARKPWMVDDRRCVYGRYLSLDAFVASEVDPRDGYDATVVIDEASDTVVDF